MEKVKRLWTVERRFMFARAEIKLMEEAWNKLTKFCEKKRKPLKCSRILSWSGVVSQGKSIR